MIIILNLLVLCLIIAVHEYGHFWAAKRCGLLPPKFAIGFGPPLLKYNFRGTEYSVRAIPLGGFVAMPEELYDLPRKKQAFIAFMGPMANLLLCLPLSIVLIFSSLPRAVSLQEQYSGYMLVLIAILGTTVFFFFAIFFSIFVIGKFFLTLGSNISEFSGPVGIVSGEAMPSTGSPWLDILLFTYLISLSLGSINLVPLSMLDGGRIFMLLFERFPKFVDRWMFATSIGLIILFGSIIVWDFVRLFIRIWGS